MTEKYIPPFMLDTRRQDELNTRFVEFTNKLGEEGFHTAEVCHYMLQWIEAERECAENYGWEEVLAEMPEVKK